VRDNAAANLGSTSRWFLEANAFTEGAEAPYCAMATRNADGRLHRTGVWTANPLDLFYHLVAQEGMENGDGDVRPGPSRIQ